jgi:WS/DGAT/MGAT family acyltransferase
MQTATRLAALGAGSLSDLPKLLEAAELPNAAAVAAKLRKPPATRFQGKVSPHRVVDVLGLPLSVMKSIRARLGDVTINDLFLTTVGGALHEYLSAKGELPEQTLTCMVPMSFRGADKTADVGNQVGMAVAPLHTEIKDPIDRLHAIRRGAAKAKAMAGVLGRDVAARLFDVLPSAASEFVTRRLVLPQMSIVVSNVRGPDMPWFMAGARLVNFAPVSIAFDGIGLNVTGFSYHGTLWVCFVSCRDMMPDPAFFADCLRNAFHSLERAALQEDGPQTLAERPGGRARKRVRAGKKGA